MLALQVARLPEGTEPLVREIAPGELSREEDYRVIAPVLLEATTSRTRDAVRIDGQAATTLELDCSRCLEAFPLPVRARFHLSYLPADQAPQGSDELEVGDDDINTAYYREGLIDLAELVHEQLYLTLPMKPLCRDECLGLCPVCGTNRNTTSCQCEARWVDPRLAGLKALLNENDDA